MLSALLQVDLTNFKAALGQNALDVIEIIIGRSASMAANVENQREALGGLAALRGEVLQTRDTDRGGCRPNEVESPLVSVSFTSSMLLDICMRPATSKTQLPAPERLGSRAPSSGSDAHRISRMVCTTMMEPSQCLGRFEACAFMTLVIVL